MARYIDADPIIQKMNDMKVEGETFVTAIEFVKLVIKDAPTADVRKNVRGEWIESIEEEITMHEYVNDLPPGKYKRYTCSECKYKTGEIAKKYIFCPNCGADMRERRC